MDDILYLGEKPEVLPGTGGNYALWQEHPRGAWRILRLMRTGNYSPGWSCVEAIYGRRAAINRARELYRMGV